MSDPRGDDNGRITLAVLRNDLMHLAAAVELLRGDMQAFISESRHCRDDTEEKAYQRELRIDRLENRMKLVYWLLCIIGSTSLGLLVMRLFGLVVP